MLLIVFFCCHLVCQMVLSFVLRMLWCSENKIQIHSSSQKKYREEYQYAVSNLCTYSLQHTDCNSALERLSNWFLFWTLSIFESLALLFMLLYQSHFSRVIWLWSVVFSELANAGTRCWWLVNSSKRMNSLFKFAWHINSSKLIVNYVIVVIIFTLSTYLAVSTVDIWSFSFQQLLRFWRRSFQSMGMKNVGSCIQHQ